MANNEKDVSLKFKAKTKDAEKGIDKITSELNKLKKSQTGIDKLGKAFKSAFATGATIAAVRKTAQSINECVDAYKQQAKAEKQLEIAAKNNPYLNSASVNSLKSFAGELQGITAIGDEQLLPLMAQLATAGRNQAEIQKIMTVALDMSASGAMSLDTAVTQLNATFSGTLGTLGKQNAELKSLSDEEIKNGAALDILGKKYQGMAEEVANTTGSADKLKNAWGDLKEVMGASFNDMISPVQNFFATIIQGWADSAKAVQEYEKAEKKWKNGTANAGDVDTVLQTQNAIEQQMSLLKQERDTALNEMGLKFNKRSSSTKQLYSEFASSYAGTEELTTTNRDKLFAQWIHEQNKAYDEQIKKVRELKKERAELQKTEEETNNVIKGLDIKAELDSLLKKTDTVTDVTTQINTLYDLKSKYESVTGEKLANEEEFNAKVIELMDEQRQAFESLSEDEIAEQKSTLSQKLENYKEYASNYTQIMKETLSLAKEYADAEAEYKQAKIEKQYADGELSLEEYNSAVEQAEKEAAEKQYEIEMWEWGIQLAQSVANTASAVTKALAEGGPYAGPALAATMGALGAVQLGTIIANKPIKPSFATGGFLVGNSTSGDKIPFKGNAGEAILNPAEMRTFMSMANGTYKNNGSAVNMPISVTNNVSDQTDLSFEQTESGLTMIINKKVNEGLNSGIFNNSLKVAQGSFNGKRYTN